MFGLFGDMFDFNGDGQLSADEMAAEVMAFDMVTRNPNSPFADEDSSEDEDED